MSDWAPLEEFYGDDMPEILRSPPPPPEPELEAA